MKNEEKRRRETGMVSRPFPEMFFMSFGIENGGKITNNPDKMRSGNDTGDFSEIMLWCTRQHDF